MSDKKKLFVVLGSILGFFFLVLTFLSFTQVPQGKRAVRTQFGQRTNEKPLTPGLTFNLAFVQDIKTFSVRINEQSLRNLSVKTNEGLNIDMDATIRYRLNAGRVNDVFDDIGTWSKVKVMVKNSFRTDLKSVADHYDDEDLYKDKRTEYSNEVQKQVKKDLEKYGITVVRVMISNVNLPKSVEGSIEEKISAAHEIEKKQRQVKIEKREAKRKRVEARGIRDAQKIINKTLTKQYLQYLFINEGIEKADPIYIPIGNGGLQMYKDVDSLKPGN